MNHLGALVTPYVDGELSPSRAAEAQAHLDMCAECRSAVVLEHAARRRTQESVRGVQPSAELTARLLAMPAGPVPSISGLSTRPRRTPFVLGGGAALVGLFVLTLFVLGAPRPGTSPSSVLAAADTDLDATATALPVTLAAAPDLADLRYESWALPSGVTVGSVDILDDGATQTLDVTLTTSSGEVRLLERSGTLDEVAAAGVQSDTVAGRTVYEVEGWYVLEAGSCVVAVHGDSQAAVQAVIAALPAADPDGVLGRLLAGWGMLVG